MTAPDAVRTAAKLIRLGYRNDFIANQLGVSPQSVSWWRRQMGYPSASKMQYSQIIADAGQMPITQVAKKYGVSRQHIYNVLRCAK